MPLGTNFIIGQAVLDSNESLRKQSYELRASPDSIVALPFRKKKARRKSKAKKQLAPREYFENDHVQVIEMPLR